MSQQTENRSGTDRRQVERRKHPRTEYGSAEDQTDRRLSQRRSGEDRRVAK